MRITLDKANPSSEVREVVERLLKVLDRPEFPDRCAPQQNQETPEAIIPSPLQSTIRKFDLKLYNSRPAYETKDKAAKADEANLVLVCEINAINIHAINTKKTLFVVESAANTLRNATQFTTIKIRSGGKRNLAKRR